jgi:hypothetical protein
MHDAGSSGRKTHKRPMAQIFQRRSNTVARASLLGVVLVTGATGWLVHAVYWSPYTTDVHVPRHQPVPFSHKHHVDGLGIDCRYCHTSVEQSAFAGIPSTETCMTCHSQLWTDAPLLAPVRQSLATDTPLRWNRVHDLPDFVFFNHSIHVAQGVGCATCHGRVDQMPLIWKEHTLYMKWCLECHRQPERFIRPRREVFNLQWTSPDDQLNQGRTWVKEYRVNTRQLTDCSMCHR